MATAPQVYGADEINAVVLDASSYRTKIGYGSLDCPILNLPSYYGHQTKDGSEKFIFEENSMLIPRPDYEVKKIMKDGIIDDFEGAVKQYNYMFDVLKLKPSEQPILVIESTQNEYEKKTALLKQLLKENKFVATFLIKNPTCVSFAHGRPNCLVVDLGHDLVTITPILDGISLRKQVLGTHYAGAFLNQQLRQLLDHKGVEVVPVYKVKSKTPSYFPDKAQFEERKYDFDISESFENFHKLRILREMKETLLQALPDNETEKLKEQKTEEDTRYFEFPNGLNVPFTKYERVRLANSLFNPSEPYTGESGSNIVVEGFSAETGKIINEDTITSREYVPLRRSKKTDSSSGRRSKDEPTDDKPRGLTSLVNQALNHLDVDLKPQLANNIILTGATSLIPGVAERLNQELTALNPGLKVRIHSSANVTERTCSAWIGGSILSSLGTFHQLWVSENEYDEVGAKKLIMDRFR
ncbi:BA75_00900T0 [Komagataella pastoris]|uniref:BA75_00900T0 n=1 Tax=Komagataella pastoris TaxID=4922 RepID=A0A1B2J832_PICPA|nr:BA75_00900T0 [Komagataella pastoris]